MSILLFTTFNFSGAPVITNVLVEGNVAGGQTVTITFDMDVIAGADDFDGFIIQDYFRTIDLIYVSGSGTSVLVFEPESAIYQDYFVTASFTQPGDGVMAELGEALLETIYFVGVTNSSTETRPAGVISTTVLVGPEEETAEDYDGAFVYSVSTADGSAVVANGSTAILDGVFSLVVPAAVPGLPYWLHKMGTPLSASQGRSERIIALESP